MKTANLAAAMAVGLMAFASQASAMEAALAQVSSVNGQVAITGSGRTAPLTSATTLKAGDRVIAMENGQAQIRYADGCVIQIQSKAMATVGAQSPCAASSLVNGSNPMQSGDSSYWEVPLGIIGVAAVFAGLVAVSKTDHDDAISP